MPRGAVIAEDKLLSSQTLQACRKPEAQPCKAICDQGLLGSKLDVVGVVDMSTDAEHLGISRLPPVTACSSVRIKKQTSRLLHDSQPRAQSDPT